MKRNLREIITLAVNYWSGFLKEPTSFMQDNGDGTGTGTPGLGMLAMMGQIGQEYDSDKIEAFENLLAGRLLNQAASSTDGSLRVDYHPCRTLTGALDDSGLKYMSMSVFPCKTSMRIDYVNGTAVVSEGYRGSDRDLEEVLKEKLNNENSDIEGMLQVLKKISEDPEEASTAAKLLGCVSTLQAAINNNSNDSNESDESDDSKNVGKNNDSNIQPEKNSFKRTKRLKKGEDNG